MTPEQRKRVAEVVTNNGWRVLSSTVFEDTGYVINSLDAVWNPSFTGDDWQRSQALAVVKKVAELGNKAKEPVYSEVKTKLLAYIDAEDIESLERLVLELSDE